MKELDKTARKKNVEKAFKIYRNVVEYKKIILVDDIYTTGNTLDACAKVLLDAGASEVYFVSLSVGQGI
jgi:predicted amidophosphoribosyltransferase